jgi:hypothetical protein
MNKLFLTTLLFSGLIAISQETFEEIENNYLNSIEGIASPETTLGSGFKNYVRWKYFTEPRLNPDGTFPDATQIKSYYDAYNAQDRTGPTRSTIANWNSIGPTYYSTGVLSSVAPGIGRADIIAFHPLDDNILFVGTPTGGLWKSLDAGATWNCLTDALGITMWGVADLVFDPTNPDHLFMATGDGDTPTFSVSITSTGVYESFDGGETWNETGFTIDVATGAWISRIISHPTDANVMYASGSFGIYKTTDGFATGTIVTSIPNIMDMEIQPGNFNTIYACTKSNTYKIDGLSLATTTIISHPSGFMTSLGVSPANPDYIYSCVAGTGALVNVFKSTDAGVSFSTLPYEASILELDFLAPTYVGTNTVDINVSQSNADELYVGSGNLYRFLDGEWTKITTSVITNLDEEYVHGDVHMVGFNSAGKLYMTTDGGLYTKELVADIFTDLSNGMSITQIYKCGSHATDPNRFNIGTQDNGQMEYKISGNWEQITGSDGWHSYYHPTNPAIFYTSTLFGHIYKSSDGGATMELVLDPNDVAIPWGPYIASYRFISPFLMHPTEPDILYAAYDDVYRSDDGGENWSKLTYLNKNFYIFAASYSDPNTFYAGTDSELYYTSTNGASASLITPPLAGAKMTDIIVDPANHDRIWVSASGYVASSKVFYSPDAGVTWNNITGPLPNFPVNCLHYVEGSNDEIYLGNDVGVFVKNDTMDWQNFSHDLPNIIVYDFTVDYTNELLRAGTFGRGVWVSDLFSSDGTSNLPEFKLTPTSELMVFPNPTSNLINFSVSNQAVQFKSGILVDLTGKIVARLTEAELATGQLDVSQLAKGNYILKLATQTSRYEKHVIIQ